MTPPLWQKAIEELKDLLMKLKEKSKKAGLKFNIQKMKIVASGPISSWQVGGQEEEAVAELLFLGSQSTADAEGSHEIR